jgi:hypothetical protein
MIMKKSTGIFIVPLMLVILCFAIAARKAEEKIVIADAVTKGMVKVKISGKGGHSGSCLSMEIQNLKSGPLTIVFEAGRRLNSADDGEQDLLMVRDQVITLKPGEKKKADLSGFCCQLKNHSPASGSGFGLGKLADEKLVKLAKFINGKAIRSSVVQEAVWCISDDQDISNISGEEGDPQAKDINELRKFICTLTGKPDPWYSTPQKRIETPERTIEPNPVEVYGEIKYVVASTTVINSELHDANGKLLFSFNGNHQMTPGTYDYNFHLKVEGFEKGKYHVILKAGTTQIMDKEFNI